jgi:hypothetical protein
MLALSKDGSGAWAKMTISAGPVSPKRRDAETRWWAASFASGRSRKTVHQGGLVWRAVVTM